MFIETAWAAADQASGEEGGVFANLWGHFWPWFVALIIFASSFVIAALIRKVLMSRIRKHETIGSHKELLLLIERAIYFGVLMVMIVISFQVVGIDVAWILGAMSVGLGFAFKDILANFLGGIVILTQQKLKIGDLIKIGDRMGHITEIDVRTTQIKGLDGTEHIIPNSDMMTDVVQNFTINEFRRISVVVGVHYATPLDKAINVSLAAVKKHESVVVSPSPEVICTEFDDSSINLEVRFWIESSEKWLLVRSHIIQQIKLDFDKAGITIPFPIRTLSVDDYDANIKKIMSK